MTEPGALLASLWEWAVAKPAGGTCGETMTRHAAMGALSRALIQAGAAARGYVAPVALVDGTAGPFYLRTSPSDAADYDSRRIQWYPGAGNP